MALLSISLAFAQRNRGKAEVFVQVAERGHFKVYLDDELISSATGRFRFYDVYNTRPILTILAGSEKVFREKLMSFPTKGLFSIFREEVA